MRYKNVGKSVVLYEQSESSREVDNLMVKTEERLRAIWKSCISLLAVVTVLACVPPSYANSRFVSSDGQLTVGSYEGNGGCSTTTPDGYYRVQNGVSGTLTSVNCSETYGLSVSRFVDTAGTYRCYGTMTQGYGLVIQTTWEIEGAVPGYRCLDVGESYTIDMESSTSL